MPAWLSRYFRRTSAPAGAAQAHLTFGATSVGRSISRTSLLLKRQLWIWPIIAVVVLGAIGYGVRVAIERTMKSSLQSELETLLQVECSMLETWLKVQEANATSLANDSQVRDVATQLIAATQATIDADATTPPTAALSASALNRRLGEELGPGMSAHQFIGYFLADKQARIIASSNLELIGQDAPTHYDSAISHALTGDATVSTPHTSVGVVKDEKGRLRTGVPTMLACAPVRDANYQVIAVLGLRIRPEQEFTKILQLGRLGQSGETYAIDKRGLLVSNSRFDEQLILLGLLADKEDEEVRSLLNLTARDPGGDLRHFQPTVRRHKLPFTKAAAGAISGNAGIDVEGYRDYRGVPVVGAWRWLPKYELGVITEIDFAEAYRPLSILRWTFFSLFGLLAASSVAIYVFTLVVARLQREAQRAVVEAKHLGQYRLEEKIGAGAMGVVYKGHHAMLRRPTAIKMLNVDKVNESSIERFEREVQITCKLNHPSTVAIYDYGRTPEGVFYYAMEYLDGIELQLLVEKYGPQPEGRVIRILKQICGSLYEAHSLGLVHRDIKPANIMLNRRGGEPDIVKVLDFGLVRALDDAKRTKQSDGLSGTPLYMSPEAIQSPELVDARSDLYAVGAVGYFLITGQPVFNAKSLVELCQQHVDSLPVSPSERLGKPISAELESALLACLEKNRAKRPQTARDLAGLLDRAVVAGAWSLDDAEAWWGRHERSQSSAAGSPSVGAARPSPENTDSGAQAGREASGSAATSAAAALGVRTANAGFDQTIIIDNGQGKS